MHTEPDKAPPCLQVGVVGAGIAGLSAAIGLARAGHQVEVFERSSFANEIGAAINVCPNATRILTRWRFDFQKWYPTIAKGYRLRNEETGQILTFTAYEKLEEEFGFLFYFLQRVDLHSGLKELAKDLGVVLQLASKVADIDCELPSITKSDGTIIQKDLFIVADGVHAGFTEKIAGRDVSAVHTGQNAFRWQVPREKLLDHPATKEFVNNSIQGVNVGCSTSAARTRLVWYPCRRGEMFNFTGIYPQKAGGLSKREGWGTTSPIKDLVETFKYFGEPILEVCKRAEEVKLWPLYAQKPLDTWTRGNAAVIGDAVHAMMPHHGQGGGLSIEDGACLEVLFSQVQSKDGIPQLLQLFQDIRKKRCSAIQIMSSVGQDQVASLEKEVQPYIDGPTPKTMDDVHNHNYGYDVVLQTQQALKTSGLWKEPL